MVTVVLDDVVVHVHQDPAGEGEAPVRRSTWEGSQSGSVRRARPPCTLGIPRREPGTPALWQGGGPLPNVSVQNCH